MRPVTYVSATSPKKKSAIEKKELAEEVDQSMFRSPEKSTSVKNLMKNSPGSGSKTKPKQSMFSPLLSLSKKTTSAKKALIRMEKLASSTDV